MADPLNPFAPQPILRDLSTSFDAAAQAGSSDITAPVAQLQRPPSAQSFSPLAKMSLAANGAGGWKKICEANPNRVSLLVRVRTGDASTLVYLSPNAASNSPTSLLFPLENGDDFVLEVTGEVYAMTASSSSACELRMMETTSVPQRL